MRPTKLTEELKAALFEMIAEGGRTNKQMCQVLDIHEDTFIEWKKNNAEFSELIKRATEEKWERLRAILPTSLSKLAKGFEVEVEEKTGRVDKDGKVKVTQVTRTKKVFAPHAGVNVFLLKNLEKEKFKDSSEITHIIPVKPPWMDAENKSESDISKG